MKGICHYQMVTYQALHQGAKTFMITILSLFAFKKALQGTERRIKN